MPKLLTTITVLAAPQQRARGLLCAGGVLIRVALGHGGIKANKQEGDGATPRGRFRMKRVWWRADRGLRPQTLLPARRIGLQDGWCDDPAVFQYNRHIRLPATCSHERLSRSDCLYDVVVELDHNTRPRIRRRGSAIFMHVAGPDFNPTAGCVALRPAELRRLLTRCGPRTRILIQ